MKFCIITHVNHGNENCHYFGYGPYIREMNIWLKQVNEVIIVAPLNKNKKTAIDLQYNHDNINFKEVISFNLTTFKNLLKTLYNLPITFFTIFKAIKSADHIHLRCPGNMGLLGCIVQIFFPNKKKTAKYAGNWDPNSKQPLSYKIQKWILNNTFLTKNMQVLVYGEWDGMSKNIKPFFTATYTDNDALNAKNIPTKTLDLPVKFMFVGSLVTGKQPLYALQLFHEISKINKNVSLEFYGEGILRNKLESYIANNQLQNKVVLHGNQPKEMVEKAYKNSHFLILASNSEGWPKVVAEAMFWGCVPLSTNVSCVHQMMGFGKRGILLSLNLNLDKNSILNTIEDKNKFMELSDKGKLWSTKYTLDKFEIEINKLL